MTSTSMHEDAGTTVPAHRRCVIAIDGPSGSGKSSTSRGVAQRLGFDYLDTGAMYRAVAYAWLVSGLASDDVDGIAELARTAVLDISLDPASPAVRINGTDVTDAIREPRISASVSTVAANQQVRATLIAQQRGLIAASQRGIVAEGRDITTVVAPTADVRVLLVADPAARVARRHAELGGRTTAAQTTDQVIRRDRDDATVTQFEKPAPGVILIDSTNLSLDEVVDAICRLVPTSR